MSPLEEGWAPDPTGRHRLRFHRNGQWTDEVSDREGEIVLDPYLEAPRREQKSSGWSWAVPKWLVTLIAVACIAVIYTVVKREGIGQTCAVTGLGQKLCGDDLRAWCNATDRLRATARDAVSDTSSWDYQPSSIDEAQAICDDVR